MGHTSDETYSRAIISVLRRISYSGDKLGRPECSFDELKQLMKADLKIDCSGQYGIERRGMFIDTGSNIAFISAFVTLHESGRVALKDVSLESWQASGRPVRKVTSILWAPVLVQLNLLPVDLALFDSWDAEGDK